ncbi:MAG: hypothetical protein JKY03_13270 [Aureispira sp.]|nr:hypothetical protein [Aureispira sp.]
MPSAKEGMEDFLDKLFLQVAEHNEENPFELFLVISNRNEQLLGEVYNNKKQILGREDIGAIAEKVIHGQFEVMPSVVKELIHEGLADLDLSVTNLLIKEVGTKKLVAKYNRQSELIFIEIDGKKKQRVDLEQILNKLDL